MKKKGTFLKGGAAVAVGSAAAAASTAGSNMMAMGDDVSVAGQDDDVVAVVNHEDIGRHIHHGTAEVVAVANDSTIEVTSPEDMAAPMPNDITQGDMPLMAGNIDSPEGIEGDDALTAGLSDNNAVVDAADAV